MTLLRLEGWVVEVQSWDLVRQMSCVKAKFRHTFWITDHDISQVYPAMTQSLPQPHMRLWKTCVWTRVRCPIIRGENLWAQKVPRNLRKTSQNGTTLIVQHQACLLMLPGPPQDRARETGRRDSLLTCAFPGWST